MIIHIYSLIWNEEKMLPYFFKHYDNMADQYFIFDDSSTDNSLSILKQHPKVNAKKVKLIGDSSILAAKQLYNHCWKQSSLTADWVIICDVDEHLYHANNLRDYLLQCSLQGITLIQPTGYDMFSDSFPEKNVCLYKNIKYGVRKESHDKPQIFNPRKIKEINFTVGRHHAYPSGEVKQHSTQELLLLHYKYLGFEYLNQRLSALKTKLRRVDISNCWGHHYLFDKQTILSAFNDYKNRCRKII